VLLDKRGDEPYITVGGSAGYDIAGNILSGCLEAMSSQILRSSFTVPADYRPFSDAHLGKNERISAWRGRDMLKKFSFYLSGARTVFSESPMARTTRSFKSTQEEYNHTLSLFRQKGKGYELYCYEVKNSLLETLGYHVTRVIVPRLFPLYMNEHLATLDSKRLQDTLKELGYSEGTLNPLPHPFP
jgi:hypothetical protein